MWSRVDYWSLNKDTTEKWNENITTIQQPQMQNIFCLRRCKKETWRKSNKCVDKAAKQQQPLAIRVLCNATCAKKLKLWCKKTKKKKEKTERKVCTNRNYIYLRVNRRWQIFVCLILFLAFFYTAQVLLHSILKCCKKCKFLPKVTQTPTAVDGKWWWVTHQ